MNMEAKARELLQGIFDSESVSEKSVIEMVAEFGTEAHREGMAEERTVIYDMLKDEARRVGIDPTGLTGMALVRESFADMKHEGMEEAAKVVEKWHKADWTQEIAAAIREKIAPAEREE